MNKATDPAAAGAEAALRGRIGAYVALTKPRIIELLLITTVPAMVVAANGWPGTWLVLATLIGGILSAAGANTINSYLDRDIDSIMQRTSRRPLPTHRVEPRRALTFGVALGVGGFVWLLLTVNALAAAIAATALLFYVFVYTLALKRSTTQNIVIGGAAGAAPVLVGWAAVTGSVTLAAWLMFAIVFFWTPPHFWALALRYRDDYSRAEVPMLPSVVGEQRAIRSILAYTGVLVVLTILLAPIADLGIIYLTAAVLLGAWFLLEAYRLYRRPSRSMTVFRVSTLYLTVLFAAMVVDVALGL
ncbi:MAG: heme o synthase [Acidimicrobiia bacterium]